MAKSGSKLPTIIQSSIASAALLRDLAKRRRATATVAMTPIAMLMLIAWAPRGLFFAEYSIVKLFSLESFLFGK